MNNEVAATEFRHHLAQVIDAVRITGEPITVTRNGRAVVTISPPNEETTNDE